MKIRLMIILVVITGYLMAHPPYGIEMDKKGNLYFTDIFHNGRGTLWKLDANKNLTAVFKDFHAHNVNIDNQGNIYSAHGEDTHTLIRINKSGNVDTLIMTEEMNDFFGGNCVVSPDGRVYFGIERKIWEWRPGGRISKLNGELKWNQGFYVDESGRIYATEIGRGKGGSLIAIDTDGSSHVVAENLIEVGDREFDPYSEVLLGVKKDIEGNLYVCDLGAKRVVRIENDGNVITHYKSEEGWSPCGIDFHGKDEYILEFGEGQTGPRVIKRNDKSIEVYFEYDNHHQNKGEMIQPENVNFKWIPWLMLSSLIILIFTVSRSKRKQRLSIN